MLKHIQSQIAAATQPPHSPGQHPPHGRLGLTLAVITTAQLIIMFDQPS